MAMKESAKAIGAIIVALMNPMIPAMIPKNTIIAVGLRTYSINLSKAEIIAKIKAKIVEETNSKTTATIAPLKDIMSSKE